MQDDTIVIACGSDDAYAMHMGVVLCSALANIQRDAAVAFYLFDGGISEESKERIEAIVQREGTSHTRLHWVDPDPALWARVKTTSAHISAATYLRLLIPDYLPQSIDKVIYLDSDLIVERDLAELWSIDVTDYAAGAVQEQVLPYASSKGGIPRYKEYGLQADTPCFNAGILLINLAWWRRHKVAKQVFEYLAAFDGPVRLQDQDGLNIVLANQWKELPWRWNVCALKVPSFDTWSDSALREKFEDEIEVVRSKPGIVHFVSARKPWTFAATDYPWADQYYYYLKRSQWFTTRQEWRRWRFDEFLRYAGSKVRDTKKTVRRKMRRLISNPRRVQPRETTTKT